MYSFQNDYSEGAHPRVLQALTDTNLIQTCGYGLDPICEEARNLIRTLCAAPESEVHFLVGGTQTNLTVIASLLQPYEAVIAAHTGHVNCHIAGEQPLCYAENLVLENCTFDPACDRAFEYSTVRADIRGQIENIKNPTSGLIVADSIGSVTIDENIRKPADCVVRTRQ